MLPRLRQPSDYASHPLLDRRHDTRYSVQVPVEIQVEGRDETLPAETSDLSRHGCYVRLQTPLLIALWVHLILRLETNAIEIEGRIVTRHPEYGNGIMFLKMRERDQRALISYLEAVARENTF